VLVCALKDYLVSLGSVVKLELGEISSIHATAMALAGGMGTKIPPGWQGLVVRWSDTTYGIHVRYQLFLVPEQKSVVKKGEKYVLSLLLSESLHAEKCILFKYRCMLVQVIQMSE
jgi:hypothetical protein